MSIGGRLSWLAATLLGILAPNSLAQSGSCRVSSAAVARARGQLLSDGVPLTVQEPAGVDRKNEPVTSGVPLPEGAIKEVGQLSLDGPAGQNVPCQFTPLSRWPDGSLKWVLLDFQSSVGASNRAEYMLSTKGRRVAPESPVTTRLEGGVTRVQTGNLKLAVTTNVAGMTPHGLYL